MHAVVDWRCTKFDGACRLGDETVSRLFDHDSSCHGRLDSNQVTRDGVMEVYAVHIKHDEWSIFDRWLWSTDTEPSDNIDNIIRVV